MKKVYMKPQVTVFEIEIDVIAGLGPKSDPDISSSSRSSGRGSSSASSFDSFDNTYDEIGISRRR